MFKNWMVGPGDCIWKYSNKRINVNDTNYTKAERAGRAMLKHDGRRNPDTKLETSPRNSNYTTECAPAFKLEPLRTSRGNKYPHRFCCVRYD